MKKEKDTTTEATILNAAKVIFERKGMDGARMQEIADEAGINKALLHYYYRSKQLLFEAVFKNAFLMLAPQLNKILNSNDSLNDKIKGFTKNYISFIIKHPYLPNFIINELNRSPEFVQKFISEKHFPNIQKFKQQVTENVNDGKIRPIKAEQLFINIMALNIFPFVAAPLLKGFLSIDNNDDYRQLMEERTTEVSNFIINALKV
ncbi:TetR/AcrR family transcriptional regulator [Lutibacter sp. A64]|uniref:TetR/AcrR family transcriptional regulator n=1 Tax=Lutibacter sp. A64 TaxID=2918526 RepID=UPI001F05B055|nr:TetR/AcrR family transcriptional regulator [Lutibacter sp. A64]UMB52885.1 TetR/AcrR family transcriptional regulator [Lutibacter sp. A64]